MEMKIDFIVGTIKEELVDEDEGDGDACFTLSVLYTLAASLMDGSIDDLARVVVEHSKMKLAVDNLIDGQ
jgi:hypothetical protein